MIGFAVKLVERAAEIGADLPEDAAKERAHAGRDRPAAVFCHKDQMIIEAIDDTSSSTKRGFHRNKTNTPPDAPTQGISLPAPALGFPGRCPVRVEPRLAFPLELDADLAQGCVPGERGPRERRLL